MSEMSSSSTAPSLMPSPTLFSTASKRSTRLESPWPLHKRLRLAPAESHELVASALPSQSTHFQFKPQFTPATVGTAGDGTQPLAQAHLATLHAKAFSALRDSVSSNDDALIRRMREWEEGYRSKTRRASTGSHTHGSHSLSSSPTSSVHRRSRPRARLHAFGGTRKRGSSTPLLPADDEDDLYRRLCDPKRMGPLPASNADLVENPVDDDDDVLIHIGDDAEVSGWTAVSSSQRPVAAAPRFSPEFSAPRFASSNAVSSSAEPISVTGTPPSPPRQRTSHILTASTVTQSRQSEQILLTCLSHGRRIDPDLDQSGHVQTPVQIPSILPQTPTPSFPVHSLQDAHLRSKICNKRTARRARSLSVTSHPSPHAYRTHSRRRFNICGSSSDSSDEESDFEMVDDVASTYVSGSHTCASASTSSNGSPYLSSYDANASDDFSDVECDMIGAEPGDADEAGPVFGIGGFALLGEHSSFSAKRKREPWDGAGPGRFGRPRAGSDGASLSLASSYSSASSWSSGASEPSSGWTSPSSATFAWGLDTAGRAHADDESCGGRYSSSEKAIRALRLAMASGWGGVEDYGALVGIAE